MTANLLDSQRTMRQLFAYPDELLNPYVDGDVTTWKEWLRSVYLLPIYHTIMHHRVRRTILSSQILIIPLLHVQKIKKNWICKQLRMLIMLLTSLLHFFYDHLMLKWHVHVSNKNILWISIEVIKNDMRRQVMICICW